MTQVLLFMVLLFIGAAAHHFKLWIEVKTLRVQLARIEATPVATLPPPSLGISPETLPGAAAALKNPPTSLQATLTALNRKPEPRDYRFPLGWFFSVEGVELQTARFQGDVNHILLTGQSDSGKDNAALNILLSLAMTHDPKHVQFAIVDGKGLDWIGWQHKAHTWLLATDPEEIGGAMERMTAERKRRRTILAAAGVSKWDNYTGDDVPLLVVFVSELLLLENAVGAKNLTAWLNTELTAARAFGIRYVIATQTASNFSTQWRSQISLFAAGYQPSTSQDAPNVGLSTSELVARGVVPPSGLPAPSAGAGGVFALVQGADSINVRTSLISDQHRDALLHQLPDAAPAPTTPATPATQNSNDAYLKHLLNTGQLLPSSAELISTALPQQNAIKRRLSDLSAAPILSVSDTPQLSDKRLIVDPELVPADEQRRILELAPTVSSRRRLCMEIYNSTGGPNYDRIKLVCDAAGVL